jgi:putative sigma-54 modulation protein
MNIQITARHDRHVSDETKDFIEAEIESLAKFYDKITSAQVVVDQEEHKNGKEDLVEINLGVDGQQLSAKAIDENLGKAFDAAVEKITRQLKKKNDKVKSHK